jgi:GntR family transcriptional regulator
MVPGDHALVLEAGLTPVPQSVATQLGASPREEVVRRRQAVIRDDSTAAILTSWFPARLAEAAPALLSTDDVTGEGILCYRPAWGEDWLAARPPTSAEAREFAIKRGSPVIVVHSRRLDAADTVIEYAELVARVGTRLAYRYEFLPGPGS